MKRPLLFGEVLFDCFPDGNDILGGAPFNVAWHLQGLGCSPLMLSRLGEDSLGEQVHEAMKRWGMDTSAMQLDSEHPTGVVQVSLKQGQPEYEIKSSQAYDFVEAEKACSSLNDIPLGLLYHGSLALRSTSSSETIASLQKRFSLPVFVDLNLRAPWWKHSQVEKIIQDATWVKLNEDELEEVVQAKFNSLEESCQNAQSVCQGCGLDFLIVTRGKDGAYAVTATQETHHVDPAPVEKIADTVGAGDAFSSIVIEGILRERPIEEILKRAVRFASVVCTSRGATSFDKEIYSSLLE